MSRLPIYRRILLDLKANGAATVSSIDLAERAGVNAAKVRKDLSYLGSYGIRGVGYDVEALLGEVSQELGLTHEWPVLIAGTGNLGSALANYAGFADRGFPVVALVDNDPGKVGRVVAGLTVSHIEELQQLVSRRGIIIGIVATPASSAQTVADLMVQSGIGSILNFAPTVISTPRGSQLRNVDLAMELQVLSFFHRRSGE